MDWGSLIGVLLGGLLAAGGGYIAQRKAHRDAVKRIKVENLARDANVVAEGLQDWNLLDVVNSVRETGEVPIAWTGATHGLSGPLGRLGFWLTKPDHVAAEIIFTRGDMAWLPDDSKGTQLARDAVAKNPLGYYVILDQLRADTKAALSRLPFNSEDAFIRNVKASREKFKTQVSEFFHRPDS